MSVGVGGTWPRSTILRQAFSDKLGRRISVHSCRLTERMAVAHESSFRVSGHFHCCRSRTRLTMFLGAQRRHSSSQFTSVKQEGPETLSTPPRTPHPSLEAM